MDLPRLNQTFMTVTAVALVSCAQPCVEAAAVVHGQVVDAAGRRVAGALVRGIHAVPDEVTRDPKHPHWDGILGEAHTDAGGKFVLQVTGSSSVDYVLAEHDIRFGVVRSPFSERLQIVIHPLTDRARRLRHERELQRQRKDRKIGKAPEGQS
jgi:hypothetical protein